jgi:tellurite methyltransferase
MGSTGMHPMTTNRAIDFFDAQFRRQIGAAEFALNPFEAWALPHVRGRLLDLGCGLGNFSIAAARRASPVTALDGSQAAIDRITAVTEQERLPLVAEQVDFSTWRATEAFDTVAAIGLFMFFARPRALQLLDDALAHVAPGGVAIINVLTEGTTFLDMFEPAHYTLFRRDEIEARHPGWRVVASRDDVFPALGGTVKCFATRVVERRTAVAFG